MDWIKAGDLVLKVLSILGTLLSLVFGAAWWSLRRAMVTHEQFTAYEKGHDQLHAGIEERLAAGATQFARLEEVINHLPSKDDVQRLEVQMTKVTGEIQVVSAILQRVEHPLGLLIEGAMKGGHGS